MRSPRWSGPAHRGREVLFLRSWDGKVGKQPLGVKTRGLPPQLTGQLFFSHSQGAGIGDKQCLGQAAVLGEAAGGQLGEAEREAEGGGGPPLALPHPPPGPQREGR